MLSVNEILKTVPFGQKTLETKFKKMVGLTPGKYIQIKRFVNLMRKYEKEQIDLKDLIYMYDYYDESHFAKDFKLFTSKSFKNYFQEDYILVKKALKNNSYDFLQ
ncbi:helix-turn-helix domain-containing protein [Polaribacter atrinae]|uniref:helix-turn-helix domain-containing protein n=1 Tax=Polaribacter atrinae TaxID=1333662 RepID=UPI0030FC5805